MFKDLMDEKQSKVDEKFVKFWEKENILEKSLEGKDKDFIFYDGPATANGRPGIHHLMAKLLKDAVCKYKSMKGYRVERRVGWDTHGLPVEVQVEKELGFKNKQDIEEYGIENFNKKCRESVMENESLFVDFTKKMGQLIDTDNPYITYDNSFIETEWWILKKFFDEGLIYEGLKILPYCPRCGTGLASHEVAQGYKNISVNSIYVPFKKKNSDTYFLVWTTTAWTLMANVALAVNPKEEYLEIESRGNKFILAKKLVDKLFDDYKILKEYNGKDLEGVEYEQLLPFSKPSKKAFYVICGDFVTMEDGTGIVHIAPAFGQDDYEVAKNYELPVLNPVDSEAKYTEGPWEGRFVLDSDLELEIIKYLKENDKLFKKQKIDHNYPHCWRCNTPLIYYSKPSLYIKTTAYKDKVVEANKKVNWYPDYVGEKRFHNWLENLVDWAISRNRYWGTPIPLWRCECGHEEMIGSVQELREKVIEDVKKDLDLHRPYVDDIHIKCEKCGKKMKRIPEVIDCWFDSGSMPFSQFHYPFENKEKFEKHFPADFISEGIDQTRGWFNSLLLISVFLKGEAPYKNVLVNDLVLAKDGSKMHKSRGNAVDPFEALEKYGADAIRWFFLSASPVWTPLRYDEDGIKEASVKMFSTLKNTYNFFKMYINIDKIDPREYELKYEELEEIDKWLLSKYNNLVKNVNDSMEEYDLNKAVKYISAFVNNDLSNWYIRRNRKRFWSKKDSNLESKKAVYKTTYEVLLGLSKLIAPFAPVLVEEIYQNLSGNLSVHLAEYPEANMDLVDLKLEEKMDLVRDLISLARQVRDNVQIKVRQVLPKLILDKKNELIIGDLKDLIKEEVNVKEIEFTDKINEYMNLSVKANYKELGPKFGKDMKKVIEILNNLSDEEIDKLLDEEKLEINLNDEEIVLGLDDLDIRIDSKEGYDAAKLYDQYVVLDTRLSDELIKEGLAREIISRVQNLRKEKDFNVVDKIDIYYDTNDQVLIDAIKEFDEEIKKETLSEEIKAKELNKEEIVLNEHKIKLDVIKK